MRVIFAGTPAIALPSLEAMRAGGHEIVAVLTRPDAALGRKRVITASPVARRAEELGIDVVRASRVTPETAAQLGDYAPDIAVIVAYGALIPPAALSVPRHGWVNVHFSLLPAWRGAAPVQHALLAGDEITGASTFLLESGLDTGPVLGQVTEVIGAADTAGALLERLSASGAMLLQQTLSAIDAGAASAVPQSGEISLAPKLRFEDARIDWMQPALAVGRRSRGVSPEPGAWTTVNGQRIKIGPVTLSLDETALSPGEVRVAGDRRSVLVGTGSHAVELHTVQPAGKKPMAAMDWARGLGRDESTVFE